MGLRYYHDAAKEIVYAVYITVEKRYSAHKRRRYLGTECTADIASVSAGWVELPVGGHTNKRREHRYKTYDDRDPPQRAEGLFAMMEVGHVTGLPEIDQEEHARLAALYQSKADANPP